MHRTPPRPIVRRPAGGARTRTAGRAAQASAGPAAQVPAGRPNIGRRGGFSLVELAAAMAITALLVALGIPAFHDWLGAYQLANHARHLAETMTRARTEAVRRGHRVNLCKSADGRMCASAGTWAGGFLVFADANGDGRVDPGESLLGVHGPAPPGVTVAANRPVDAYVSYTDLGTARTLSGALQMGTFTLCRRHQRALQVVLAGSGRVRIETTAARCT